MVRFSLAQSGEAPTTDKNLLTNPSLEDGTFNWLPADWVMSDQDGGIISIERDTSMATSGTYALKLTNDGSGNKTRVEQEFDSLTENDSYTITSQAAGTDGNTDVGLVVYYEGEADDYYFYNFTGVNAGTYTNSGTWNPTSDQIDTQNTTSSMALVTFSAFTIPADGEIVVNLAGGDSNNGVSYFDEVTMKKDGTGSDIMLNGDFSGTWDQVIFNGDELTGWTAVGYSSTNGAWSANDYEESIIRTTDAKYGTYAIEFQYLEEATGIKQQKTGLTPGTSYKIKLWNKDGDDSAKAKIFALNGSLGSQTQAYDFTNEVWDADVNTTYEDIATADANREKQMTGGVDYTQDSITLVAPASGVIDLAVFGAYDFGDSTLVDYIEITEAKPSPSYAYNPIMSHYGFDMTVDGDANKKLIYTVPTGKKFLWFRCVMECASVDNYTSGGTVNVGWTVGNEYNDIMNNQQIDTTVGKITVTDLGNSGEFAAAGTDIYAYIDDDPVSGKAVADAMTANFYLFGMLIDA